MDCFAILEEPRRPWLDPEALKEKFLARSAALHPDRAGSEAERRRANEQFAELNQAYQRLRDPKERLQHLLELETGAPPAQVQRVPAELMDLAMKVGQICNQADGFLEEKAGTTSPLLQVGLLERSEEWTEKLGRLRGEIERRRGELEGEVRSLDHKWASGSSDGHASLLSELEALYRLVSYYSRWSGQVQERITRLSF